MVYNATITWFLIDGYGTQPAQVKIAGKDIRVDCIENSEFEAEIWTGNENGAGHYTLRDSNGGEASLHRFKDASSLEGHCNENYSGGKGMWQIELKNPVVKKSKK